MIEHNGAFKAAVDAALAAHTVADITAAFKEADIPGGPVLSIADSYKDPQVHIVVYHMLRTYVKTQCRWWDAVHGSA